MPVTGLHHCNIRVPREQLDSIRDFYCDVLGLLVGERPPFSSVGYWLYAADQAVVHLSTAREGDVKRTSGPTTLNHIAYACTDYEGMLAKLESKGVAYKIMDVPLVAQRQIFFNDTLGNGIELTFDLR